MIAKNVGRTGNMVISSEFLNIWQKYVHLIFIAQQSQRFFQQGCLYERLL